MPFNMRFNFISKKIRSIKYNYIILTMNFSRKTIIPVIIALCLLLATSFQKKQGNLFNMRAQERLTNYDRPAPDMYRYNCSLDEIQPNYVIEATEQQRRLLAASDPHGFRAIPLFPDSTPGINININVLKKLYAASAKYFQSVLQVTALSASMTIYPPNFGQCGGMDVPTVYQTTGFSQDTADSIILIDIVNATTQSYVAQASTCVYSTWPTYGFVRYNAFYVGTDLSQTGKFHNNIMTTIHQLGHVYGMANYKFKNRMRGTYGASGFLAASQTIGIHPNKPGVQMVIMSNTKAYIQSYFGCADTTIGGLLEDQGGAGTLASHWERQVFLDDFLTGTVWSSMQKISALSLHLLKDTGYFYSVDVTKASPVFFGKGKGCSFALNQATSATPEYCTGSGTGCGFYGEYYGYCATQTYTSGKYIRPYSNRICNKAQTTLGGSTITGDYYGAKGRCITYSGAQHCYKTQCNANNGIIITLNGQTVTCAVGETSKTVSGQTLTCPTNNVDFCSIKQCENWCYTQGLCLNGVCMLVECSTAIENCLSCDTDTLRRCTSCSNNLFPSSTKTQCVLCSTAIANALTCVVEDKITKAMSCSTNLYPTSDRLSCQNCNTTMTECQTCAVASGVTTCISCKNSKFPTSNKRNCDLCQNIISSCTSCSVDNGVTKCLACSVGKAPSADGLSCVQASCTISGCNVCIDDSGTQKCIECSNSKFPVANKLSCDTCGNIISDCTTCLFSSARNRTECSICGNSKLLVDPLTCQTCGQSITNCLTCRMNSTVVNCYSCLNSMVPSANLLNCQACQTRISDCSSCAVSAAGVTCLSCTTSGNVPSVNKNECINCANRIPSCSTCNVAANGSVTCGACTTNYIPNSNGTVCRTCGEHISRCTTCTYNSGTKVGTCTQCSTGFWPAINGLSCKTCPQLISKCRRCSSNTACTQCVVGFYILSSLCAPCTSPCRTCQASATTCKSCIEGYYLITSNSTCAITPKIVRSYGGVCNIGGKDIFCKKGCKVCQCSSATSQTCQSAHTGYSLHSGGYVVKCPNGCATCDSTAPSTCYSCLNLYTLVSTSCSICHTSCASCDPSDSNKCLTCTQGNQINSQGTCSACTASNCKICTSSGQCSTCDDGYYLDSSGKCQECIFNCGTCLQTDINTCTSCGDMFYLNGTKCLQCPTGCRNCDATGCTKCIAGYSIDISTKTCKQDCGFLCATCSSTDLTTCTSCFGGYELSNGQCLPNFCTSGCTVCPLGTRLDSSICLNCTVSNCSECPSAASTCQSCMPGYYLASSSSCAQCPTECTFCTSDTFCTSCKSGYTFAKEISESTETTIQGKCIACISPCKTCVLNPKHCQTCIDQYQINDHKCVLKNKIKIRIVLDGIISTFYSTLGGPVNFKTILLQLLGLAKANRFTFNKVKSGSIQIEAQIGNDPNQATESVCTQAETLKGSLNTGSTIQGLNILQSQFIPQATDSTTNCQTTPQNNLILIIALAAGVPTLIIVLIIIIVIVVCIRNKNAEKVCSVEQTIDFAEKIQDSTYHIGTRNALNTSNTKMMRHR